VINFFLAHFFIWQGLHVGWSIHCRVSQARVTIRSSLNMLFPRLTIKPRTICSDQVCKEEWDFNERELGDGRIRYLFRLFAILLSLAVDLFISVFIYLFIYLVI
jgi:hypothetical protein